MHNWLKHFHLVVWSQLSTFHATTPYLLLATQSFFRLVLYTYLRPGLDVSIDIHLFAEAFLAHPISNFHALEQFQFL